jgi:hypothetical protein
LEGLPVLEVLLLTDTQITDAGLRHLKGLYHLRLLRLVNTKVTEDGVDDLKKALPDLEVEYWTEP